MSPEAFAYWLQGIFEGNPNLKTLDEAQVACVKQHLSLVLTNVTSQPQQGLSWVDRMRGLRPTVRGAGLGSDMKFC